jgi:hypothetical protein
VFLIDEVVSGRLHVPAALFPELVVLSDFHCIISTEGWSLRGRFGKMMPVSPDWNRFPIP